MILNILAEITKITERELNSLINYCIDHGFEIKIENNYEAIKDFLEASTLNKEIEHSITIEQSGATNKIYVVLNFCSKYSKTKKSVAEFIQYYEKIKRET